MRVLNVDEEARKLVLSMRQKPRASSSSQGDLTKYADMLAEVRRTLRKLAYRIILRCRNGNTRTREDTWSLRRFFWRFMCRENVLPWRCDVKKCNRIRGSCGVDISSRIF